MEVTMLEVDGVSVSFGGATALSAVSLDVAAGGACAVLGRNGAGKSTLLRTIGGLVSPQRGHVRWEGEVLRGGPSEAVRRGIRLVTESGNVFTDLSVRDNLRSAVPMLSWRKMNDRITETVDTFPILRKLLTRHAGTLSGGERQTVAVARALIAHPRLLLLDEPSLGLAPALSTTLLGHLANVVRDRGVTLLVAEQNMRLAEKACADGCWLETGRIIARGPLSDLGDVVFGVAEDEAKEALLG
jgi:branched-chain amino acid transport system ATP-binding protein